MSKIADITGVVLAGGKSSRFGKNKAFATFQNVPLIERILETMKNVFENVLIVTNTPDTYRALGVPTVQDFQPDQGPLGGIFTALRQTKNDKVFVVGCDMPLLNPEIILQITNANPEADAVIPVHQGQPEYLMALYSRLLLPSMCQALGEGELSLRAFCCKIANIAWVPVEANNFRDVDTPADLDLLEKEYAD